MMPTLDIFKSDFRKRILTKNYRSSHSEVFQKSHFGMGVLL